METSNFVIADSSGLVSLATETDRNHAVALAAAASWETHAGAILVPTEVLSETLNVLSKKAGRETAITTARQLLATPDFLIIPTEQVVLEAAFALFQSLPASVSFTDCVVMSAASANHTLDIFGFDEVFRQNGFTIPQAV